MKQFLQLSALFFLSLSFLSAQVSKNCAVLLEASASGGSNPRILIEWEDDEFAYEYVVLRKKAEDKDFVQISGVLNGETTAYLDSDAAEGIMYEYQVRSKSYNDGNFRWRAFGYITAHINKEPEVNHRKVLILIDETIAETIAEEIKRLEIDMAKEGWGIISKTAPRAENYDAGLVQATKNIILNEYQADNNLSAVLLIGRIAVPYSGGYTNSVKLPPDAHGEGSGNHTGAWPADNYYGDIDGNWTDNSVNVTTSNRDVNKNIPGDGKFDQMVIPSQIELAIGRVDFYNMPAFEESELDLYKRYLDKNHAYRSGEMIIQKKALIDEDRFQLSNLGYREAFSANGWRNFVPLVGYNNLVSDEWSDQVFNTNYLWAYGGGAGSFSSSSGVVNSQQLSENENKAVFTFLFGSYFGDWDSQNNLMRAAIAAEGNTLTCGWASRPHWFVHRMGSGEPISESLLLTQNNAGWFSQSQSGFSLNSSDYFGLAVIQANWFTDANGDQYFIPEGYPLSNSNREIHVALMGDPTLTQDSYRNLPKASSLTAVQNTDKSISLSWSGGPTDDIKNWDIYRANWFQGPYEKINSTSVTTENFTDNNPNLNGKNVYLVRRRHYLNDNQGIRFALSQGEVVAIDSEGLLSANQNKFDIKIGPNPARNNIAIQFVLERNSPVQIGVYDAEGNQIKNWDFMQVSNGSNSINWDFGNSLQNGVYFVKFVSNNDVVTKKFIKIN